jgi:hypothetical protein
MKDNKYLLVKGIAGLGNRIRCVLTAILYARLTGRRLIIDWRDRAYSSDGTNVFPLLFKCPLCGLKEDIPDTDSVRPSIWNGRLHESAFEMQKRHETLGSPDSWKKYSFDLSRLDYQEDILVMWSYTEQVDLLRKHFRGELGELRDASTETILRKLLREELILHPSLREKVDQVKVNRFQKETVGIHVRFTDRRTQLWTIVKKLDALLEGEPDLQIFLATDNVYIKNIFQDIYANVFTTQQIYPKSGMSMHHDEECQDRTTHGIEALIDLYLLAECTYLIIDRSSSFSYIASLLTSTASFNIVNIQSDHKKNWVRRRIERSIWLAAVRLGLFSGYLRILGRLIRLKRHSQPSKKTEK